ncbi:MAG: hypothetical protein Q8M94_02770 [Ignavibacteria bacterium]|nr:hypothetical protein [Ignavibacteria bacterium]
MSWESIFTNIGNILKLITLIGPMIEFIEMLFKKVFPTLKLGKEKKELAMEWGMLIMPPQIGAEELSGMIEAEVLKKNESGEFTHVDHNF